MKEFLKCIVIFSIGGLLYYFAEILFRGYSFGAMIILGGICFILCGRINEKKSRCTPLVQQMMIAAIEITAVEFFAGVILNIILGLHMWDYSNMPGNILGQICPQFMILWFFLSAPGIVLDDLIRWKFFGQEKPHYHLFKKVPDKKV
ncbi:MAG: hypothetical protein ACI4EO_01790 [Blautia sp.]